jgi:hypothetical protein
VSGFPRRDAAHFVRRSEEIVLRRNPAPPLRYHRHRRSKIETFEIAGLDVQRQRVMLWGTTTEYFSGFLHVAVSRARKNAWASFRVDEIAKTKVLRERDR